MYVRVTSQTVIDEPRICVSLLHPPYLTRPHHIKLELHVGHESPHIQHVELHLNISLDHHQLNRPYILHSITCRIETAL